VSRIGPVLKTLASRPYSLGSSGRWRPFRNGRKRSCSRRLLHRWDVVSKAGVGGFGTVLAGRSRPRGLRCSGHQPGRDVADELSLWASSCEG
jgi:hypothetical protein